MKIRAKRSIFFMGWKISSFISNIFREINFNFQYLFGIFTQPDRKEILVWYWPLSCRLAPFPGRSFPLSLSNMGYSRRVLNSARLIFIAIGCLMATLIFFEHSYLSTAFNFASSFVNEVVKYLLYVSKSRSIVTTL